MEIVVGVILFLFVSINLICPRVKRSFCFEIFLILFFLTYPTNLKLNVLLIFTAFNIESIRHTKLRNGLEEIEYLRSKAVLCIMVLINTQQIFSLMKPGSYFDNLTEDEEYPSFLIKIFIIDFNGLISIKFVRNICKRRLLSLVAWVRNRFSKVQQIERM